MGQYYKFVNTTKQTESQISLPFNFGLPWVKNLQDANLTERQTIFDFVMENNEWEKTDDVIALGDDLQRGFTQLAVELIALAQANNATATNLFYGVISIGDVWQFGLLDYQSKQVRQDINLFRVPEDVEDLLQVLIAILQ